MTRIQCLLPRGSQAGAGDRQTCELRREVPYGKRFNAGYMQGICPVLVKVQRRARQLCLEHLRLLQRDAVCRRLRKGAPGSRLVLERLTATGPQVSLPVAG